MAEAVSEFASRGGEASRARQPGGWQLMVEQRKVMAIAQKLPDKVNKVDRDRRKIKRRFWRSFFGKSYFFIGGIGSTIELHPQ